jgi:hypothetical protein
LVLSLGELSVSARREDERECFRCRRGGVSCFREVGVPPNGLACSSLGDKTAGVVILLDYDDVSESN